MDERLLMVLNAVFAMMTVEKQREIPPELNPILRILEKKARRVRRDAIYYDYGDPTEFNLAYDVVKDDPFDVANLKNFQKVLLNLMVDLYHVNSYVQETLVDMYRAVDDVINRLSQPSSSEKISSMAEILFNQLLSFESRLEQSLQRGPVRWGFVKVRSVRHWDLVVSLRYFYDLLWRMIWWYEWPYSSYRSRNGMACQPNEACGCRRVFIEGTSCAWTMLESRDSRLRNIILGNPGK